MSSCKEILVVVIFDNFDFKVLFLFLFCRRKSKGQKNMKNKTYQHQTELNSQAMISVNMRQDDSMTAKGEKLLCLMG